MSKADILHNCLQSEAGTEEQRAEWITELYELHEQRKEERDQARREAENLREVEVGITKQDIAENPTSHPRFPWENEEEES